MDESQIIKCPDEVADVIITILNNAILSIRMAANAGQMTYCAIEANHIHNLPGLLRHYEREDLESYLKWGRDTYIQDMKQFPGAKPEVYSALWQRLERFLAGQSA